MILDFSLAHILQEALRDMNKKLWKTALPGTDGNLTPSPLILNQDSNQSSKPPLQGRSYGQPLT